MNNINNYTFIKNFYGFYEIYYKNKYMCNAIDMQDVIKKIHLMNREKAFTKL